MKSSVKPKWFRELLRRRLFFCLLIAAQLAVLLFFIFNQSRASVIMCLALQGISIAVASPEGGLAQTDVAVIADVVLTQSEFSMEDIRIVEVY